MNDLLSLWQNVILTPWYIGAVVLVLILSLFTNEGRIGRIACHVGLHDSKIVPSSAMDYSIRIACTRCKKRWWMET